MTDELRPEDTGDASGEEHAEHMPRREASVTLRRGHGPSDVEAEMFDPANQSAAEALRISYNLLLGGIVVLVVLFLLSGFKTVEEGKIGIRLLAGAIAGRDLQPGMHWSAPQPLGEILTYHRNPPRLEIRDTFYPGEAVNSPRTLEQLSQTAPGNLDPGRDGSLITGDLNLVHAQWVVQYSRRDIDDYAEHIQPEFEDELVRLIMERGAVHAVAGAPLDDVIKPAGQTGALVSERARISAQEALDRLDSGLRIETVDMQGATVPLHIYRDWAELAGEDAKAAQKIEQAKSERSRILNEVAGAAAPLLLDQISRYERAVEREDELEAERTLDVIHALLDGEPVVIDDREVGDVVSGDVTTVINAARRYRSTVASRERARLSTFRSILQQFRLNPSVVIHREWADAFNEFLGKDFVQLMHAPAGTDVLELMINQDPSIAKEMEQQKREAAAAAARERRLREVQRQNFQPRDERVLQAEPGG